MSTKLVTTQVYSRQDEQDILYYCLNWQFLLAQVGRRVRGFPRHLLSGTEERQGSVKDFVRRAGMRSLQKRSQ